MLKVENGRHSGVFHVTFEHISHLFLVFFIVDFDQVKCLLVSFIKILTILGKSMYWTYFSSDMT